jgi:uncharacterized protein YqkB
MSPPKKLFDNNMITYNYFDTWSIDHVEFSTTNFDVNAIDNKFNPIYKDGKVTNDLFFEDDLFSLVYKKGKTGFIKDKLILNVNLAIGSNGINIELLSSSDKIKKIRAIVNRLFELKIISDPSFLFVTSIEFFVDILTKHEARSYKPIMNTISQANRFCLKDIQGTIYYENKSERIKLYDKKNELLENQKVFLNSFDSINLTRFEYSIIKKGKIQKAFSTYTDVSLLNFLNEAFYIKVQDVVKKRVKQFFSINLSFENHQNIDAFSMIEYLKMKGCSIHDILLLIYVKQMKEQGDYEKALITISKNTQNKSNLKRRIKELLEKHGSILKSDYLERYNEIKTSVIEGRNKLSELEQISYTKIKKLKKCSNF